MGRATGPRPSADMLAAQAERHGRALLAYLLAHAPVRFGRMLEDLPVRCGGSAVGVRTGRDWCERRGYLTHSPRPGSHGGNTYTLTAAGRVEAERLRGGRNAA